MLLRAFGLEGLRRRLERHCALALSFAGWIDEAPDWERLAPVPFSTVCFRHVPPSMRADEAGGTGPMDEHNAALMDAVNRTGEVFLSHTRLNGTFTIRLSVGNLRTEDRHVARAWELLRREAARIEAVAPEPAAARIAE
jgi:aromatic-L-amino-acid decarboxylase